MRVSQTLIVTLAVGAAPSLSLAAVDQLVRLTPVDPITSDIFSYDQDFDGQTVVGGAPFGTYGGFSQPGRAYVFELKNGVWAQAAKLTPPTLQTAAWFGLRVAVRGDILLVAAPGLDTRVVSAGAVYVYERIPAQGWALTATLLAPLEQANAQFGSDVAIDGERLLISARGDTNERGIQTGAAYVYERVAGAWTSTAKLVAPDGQLFDTFGRSVALQGTRALIGAEQADTGGILDAGAAYVFELQAGTWQFVQRLNPPTPSELAIFGDAVSLRGDYALIGAPQHPVSGMANAGEAYVFRQDGGTWTLQQALTSPFPDAGDQFGIDVSLSNNRALVGAYLYNGVTTGRCFLYRNTVPGWQLVSDFTAEDTGGILIGWRNQVVGDLAAVAAPFYQTNRGAAYVFGGMQDDGCPAPGDVDGDCCIEQPDLNVLLAHFGCEGVCLGDIDGDGLVGQLDINLLLAGFGSGCP